MKTVKSVVKFILAILICQLAGFVGSIATIPSIPTWYAALNKPSFNPPNWIFGPVWTTLYILMGIALFLVWNKGWSHKGVKVAVWVFLLQLILNSVWSIVFFGWHAPFWAFMVIALLWLIILLSIINFWRVSALAGILLLPYILWVSFASVLNFYVFWLNR